jgi:hypothetical protein
MPAIESEGKSGGASAWYCSPGTARVNLAAPWEHEQEHSTRNFLKSFPGQRTRKEDARTYVSRASAEEGESAHSYSLITYLQDIDVK